jgi:CheY-like chemotaxis protein
MLERSQGGLGLGLAIVKSLVEAHGGTVSAHSDGAGKGSTFAIELPAAGDQVEGDSPVRLGRPVVPSTAAMRILVVDDNRDAASTLQSALRMLGHDVMVAHDGPSALAAATAFLDIGLPGMSGYELAAALRRAHEVRLVAVTGYGQEGDRQRSRQAGFDAHLVKPVEIDQITRTLEALPGGSD